MVFKTGIYFDILKDQSSRRVPLLLWAESSYPRASNLTPVPTSPYPAQSPKAKGDRNLAVSCGEGRGELGQLAKKQQLYSLPQDCCEPEVPALTELLR